jgi:hypothetical protein
VRSRKLSGFLERSFPAAPPETVSLGGVSTEIN